MERDVPPMDAAAKNSDLHKNGRSMNRSDYSVKILKPVKELQQITNLVESKDLKFHTMPRMIKETSRLREELSKLKGDEDRLNAMNKVDLMLGTKVFDLKTTPRSIKAFLQEKKARVVETEKGLE